MADTKIVRTAVQKMTKAILDPQGRQIAENGKHQEIGDVNSTTGFWEDRGRWSKPGHWLIILERKDATTVVASLPNHPNAKKIAGSINAARRIHMGLSTRIVAAVKDGATYTLHDQFEWLLLFVFPDLPVNIAQNDSTSGDTASFDPATGELLMKEKYHQPYVAAQLFKTVDNASNYGSGANAITYDQATAALVDFINIAPSIDDSSPVTQGFNRPGALNNYMRTTLNKPHED